MSALVLGLVFVTAFPLAYVSYKKSVLYGGWRHMMFVFPSFAVMAGIGFSILSDQFKKNSMKLLSTLGVLLLFILPVRHTIANHPYEYVYYNELAGGVNEASKSYETDYYQHSVKEAAEWLAHYIETNDKPKKGEKRKVCHYTKNELMQYFFAKDTANVQFIYSRFYERSMKDWDYCISFAGYISADEIKNKYWPTKDAIHVIYVDNVPICAVEKRGSKEDFLGYEALQANKFQEAYDHLTKYHYLYPHKPEALYLLGVASFNIGKQKEAEALIKEALDVYNVYTAAYGALGNMYMQMGKLQESVDVFRQYIKVKDNDSQAHYGLALTYYKMAKYQSSADALLHLLNKVDNKFPPAYDLLMADFQKLGRTDQIPQVQEAKRKNTGK